MNLTKQEAIQHHRDMWNWIANRLEYIHQTKTAIHKDINDLKETYLKNIKLYNILNNCFCCHYVGTFNPSVHWEDSDSCKYCPIEWGTEHLTKDVFCEHGLNEYEHLQYIMDNDKESTGLYEMCGFEVERGNYGKAAEIARKIANLPEKLN